MLSCGGAETQARPVLRDVVTDGLNAVYLPAEAKWIRLDARGNKPGVQAEFSTGEERLAYVVRPELDEIDYPTIHTQPHPKIVKALREHTNLATLVQYFLPDHL